MFHTTKTRVKHGLIVIENDNEPEGLLVSVTSLHGKVAFLSQVIPASGQWFEYNRWKPHKNWKAEGGKETYDPSLMRLEVGTRAKAKVI